MGLRTFGRLTTGRLGSAMVPLGALLSGGALVLAVHLILFRRTALQSMSPLPWVAVSAISFVVTVIAARRRAEDARVGPWQRWLCLSPSDTAMAVLIFVLLAGFALGFTRATGDGREYFAQTRSMVIDGDLDFRNEIETFRTHGVTWVMPPGTSFAWVPFFVAAHVWIRVIGALGFEVSPDGYWNPYQQALGLGTLLLGWVGLVLLYRVLRRSYDGWTSAACTWAFTLGTFVFYYLTVEATYSHGVALFAVMLFVTLFLAQGTDRSSSRLFVLGLAGGFMTCVRWENATFLLLPLVRDAGYLVEATLGRRWRRLLPYGAAVLGVAVALLPQVLIWGASQGRYLAVPALAGQQWWGESLPLEVLFSSDRGLMTWHPLFFVAALGLPLAWRRDPAFVATLTIIVVVLVYVNGASAWLAGGAGFGYRRLMVTVPAFAIGLAALLDFLVRRPRVMLAATLGAFVFLNLAMVADVVRGTLAIGAGSTFDELTRSVYRMTGNPFAAPRSTWLRLRHGMSPTQYDELGRQSFNNLVVEVGTEADGRFLLRGWGGPERDPLGAPFRWVVAESASFVAPLKETQEVGTHHPLPSYTLELSVEPFPTPDARQQVMRVLVNGNPVADGLRLEPGLSVVRVPIPASHLTRYLNFFELRFASATSPRSIGRSEDDRTLAARVTRIGLLRGD